MAKMNIADWNALRYFNPRENWGNPDEMEVALLIRLDHLRGLTGGHGIHINCAYATAGHAPNSYHYKGMAADGYIEDMSLLDQYLLSERVGFKGLGVYGRGVWNTPGLHWDIRDTLYFSRWTRTASGAYVPLTAEAFQ
jgi:hypothetical protein